MANRCQWSRDDPLYQKYHDTEWGAPSYDDQTLFEFLILEGAQAGLSWITVLRKREAYRKLFDNFEPKKIAHYSDKKLDKILLDPSIIRNRLKIYSVRQNSKAFPKWPTQIQKIICTENPSLKKTCFSISTKRQ